MNKNFNFVLSILILIIISNCKKIQTSFTLSNFNKDHYKYLTKFSYRIGEGTVQIRAKLSKTANDAILFPSFPLNLIAIRDDDWHAFQQIDVCKDKEALAKMNYWFDLPMNGDWSIQALAYLNQISRTRVWYILVTDCERRLEIIQQHNIKINFEVIMKNSDGSHFSEEENGMIMWYFIQLLLLAIFLSANSWRFMRFYYMQENWDMPFFLLNVAICSETLSIILEFIHYLIYSNNGAGSVVLDFFSQLFGIFSQFMITLLIILIAHGWSIDFGDLADNDFYLPVSILVMFFHVMIIGLGRISDDNPNKFHDYESIPGYVIMFLKLISYGIFMYFTCSAYIKSGSNPTKRSFLIRLCILGTIYILALPIIVFISSTFVVSYVRNKVVVFGTLTLQIGASIILTYLLSSKKSKYYQISMKGRTILPSGKLD